jgi:alpha-glucosidase
MLSQRMIGSLGCLLGWVAPALGGGWTHLGDVTACDFSESTIAVTAGQARLRIDAVTDHVLRVRVAPDGDFGRDFSWAVPARTIAGQFTEESRDENAITCATAALRVRIQRNPCRLTVTDLAGNAIAADHAERGAGWSSAASGDARPVRVCQQLPDGTRIFGLGEKTGGMHRDRRVWSMWNSDTAGYRVTTDPIYASVPFFITARDEQYHGVFFDNPWRTTFDLGKTENDVLVFAADGGPLDYYIIAGPSPRDVIIRYTALTGRMPLPPKWAIGYHQCRYGYFPTARVREVARGFRTRRIPCDVLYFDIDYMDGYRCFTWDEERFPDPRGLMDELHGMGFRTIAIIDPGIKNEPGYEVFDSGSRIDAWVKQPDGEPYVGRVWPGDCVFPDFTADRVRQWWSNLFPPFIAASGLDGVWNDMNEPANFAGPRGTVPLDLRHDNAGQPASHRACHNIYGMQMARATLEGLRRARPDERPFTLTRATYAGGQRHAAIWTGDNVSSWEHLAMSIPMALGTGVSGIPMVGPDIGGFIGGATPEMYARWIQMGALFPFARTHTSCPNPDQEPWSFGPRVTAVARSAIERRYAWMPYLYTLFEEASRTGLPIMRPIWLEQPGYDGWMLDSAFFLGSDIYVAPRLSPGDNQRFVELPRGVWFDGNTGDIQGGGRWVPVDDRLETLPHYFRGGAIVPTQSPVQHVGETAHEPLILDVWPYGESTGELYEDDGISHAHRDGAYRRTLFACSATDERIRFTVQPSQGDYDPGFPAPLVRIHHLRDRWNPANQAIRQDATTFAAGPATGELAPGTFRFDADAGLLTLRLLRPLGAGQTVTVGLADTAPAPLEPVTLRFDGDGPRLYRPRGATRIDYSQGAARFVVRWSGSVKVLLPRLRVPADALPIAQFRVSTQHAGRMRVRFASESDPQRISDQVTVTLAPDGALHDYRVDMRSAAGDAWRGTIYFMELEFDEGIRGTETIAIERIAFMPALPAGDSEP